MTFINVNIECGETVEVKKISSKTSCVLKGTFKKATENSPWYERCKRVRWIGGK